MSSCKPPIGRLAFPGFNQSGGALFSPPLSVFMRVHPWIKFPCLIVKPVTHFGENFPWIVEVKSAKRQTVVIHCSTVSHIQCRNRHRELFAEILSKRKIKRFM